MFEFIFLTSNKFHFSQDLKSAGLPFPWFFWNPTKPHADENWRILKIKYQESRHYLEEKYLTAKTITVTAIADILDILRIQLICSNFLYQIKCIFSLSRGESRINSARVAWKRSYFVVINQTHTYGPDDLIFRQGSLGDYSLWCTRQYQTQGLTT